MVKRENNLLANSENGWGKHIEIYQGGVIEESELVELFQIGYIPFFIIRKGVSYLAIIGQDLTSNQIKKDEDGKVLTVTRVSEIITELDWALCQVFAYLKWEKSELDISYVGKLGEMLVTKDFVKIFQTDTEPAKPVKDKNLLEDSLDSGKGELSKYVKVYRDKYITEKEVIEHHETGYVPIFIFNRGKQHLVILGPDITKPLIHEDEIGKVLYVKRISKIVNELDWFMETIYEALGWDKKYLTVLLIGNRPEKESVRIYETGTF